MLAQADTQNPESVLRLADIEPLGLQQLLGRFGMRLERVEDDHPIPGSFWGDEEAGLVGNLLYARADTPIHSVLHEAGHYVCMPPARRRLLNTNAGGDYAEENAVCYLQILLADKLTGFGRYRLFSDMDTWGYSFRLGSAQAWFEHDADDARDWLTGLGLIDTGGEPTWRLRE